MNRLSVQIVRPGGVEALNVVRESVNLEKALKEDEVLVENKFIGVNFIDTYHRSGLYPLPSYPAIPGREAAGIVTAISESKGPLLQKSRLKVGDRVAYLGMGAYASLTVVGLKNLIKLPDDISLEKGAAMLLQGLTALVLLQEASSVKKGDVILVHAIAGGVGLWLLQLAKTMGVTVIGTTSSHEKAKLALEYGADHVIIYRLEDVVSRVKEITKGKGVAVVYDGIGKDTVETSLACLAKYGKFVSFGNASGKIQNFDVLKLSKMCLSLCRPTLFEYLTDPKDFERLTTQLLNLISKHKLQALIYKIYPLEDVAQAHSDLESSVTTGKLLLYP